MRNVIVLFCLLSLGWAKDVKQVQVMATHSVTHDARDTRAIIDRGIMGAGSPGRQVESFNLDTVINGEHVLLACEDDKGCEAPALGTYSGDLNRRGHMHLTFDLPLTHKQVTRWYKIAGSW
jgi:hypothetical protein